MYDLETIRRMNAAAIKKAPGADVEKPMVDLFTAVMIVEGAQEADEEGFIAAAQLLIDTGQAWLLQGHFGRTCDALIRAGVCSLPLEGERQE